MSTSSASSVPPTLSIVVASNGAPGSVDRCLAALEGQLDGAEVIVCPRAADAIARRRFSFARFLQPRDALVPELWRDGIDAATGEAVALTISPMRVAADWVPTLRGLLVTSDVVGGAIDPGEGLRLPDWAEYFCRYARDMLPFEPHPCLDLPGDNAGYRRAALTRTRDVWRDGFWEPEVHRAVHEQGGTLRHEPALVVRQGRSAGFWEFLAQRLRHGREYGRARGRRSSSGRNLAGVAGAAVVPVVLVARTGREVFRRRRYRARLLAALPILLAYDLAWAAGEALGHAAALRGR